MPVPPVLPSMPVPATVLELVRAPPVLKLVVPTSRTFMTYTKEMPCTDGQRVEDATQKTKFSSALGTLTQTQRKIQSSVRK
jgi:hypothetical protein